ncbi:MAG: hypothetical protein V3T58_01330 [Candidatus Hydrothermarchaeales archaeon]
MRFHILLVLLAVLPLVSASNVDFYITGVQPQQLAPGESTVLNITLKNLGTDYAVYVKSILDPAGTSPLVAVGSAKIYLTKKAGEATVSSELFGVISQGEEVTAQYPIFVNEDATFGVHNIPLKVLWKDSLLTAEEETLYFGIKISGEADLVISGVNSSPSRIFADDEFTLLTSLENIGKDSADSVKAELLMPEEFSGDSLAFLGTIGKDASAVGRYNLKAAKEAKAGAYDFSLRISYLEEGITHEVERDFQVFVHEYGEITLAITDVSTEPSKVYPDSDFVLSLGLENVGKQDAKSVELVLGLPTGVSGEYSSFLGTLAKEGKSTAKFNLKASRDMLPGPYDSTMKIGYVDERGLTQEAEKDFQIFIHKRGEVKLEIAGVSTSPTKIYPGSDFTLSIQLENIGTQDAKSVKTEITPLKEFIGEYSSFIGKIEEDDVSSGIFDLRLVKDAKPQSYNITMKVIYIDEKGAEFSDDMKFALFVDEAPQSNKTTIVISIVVIGAVGFYLWKKRRVEVE